MDELKTESPPLSTEQEETLVNRHTYNIFFTLVGISSLVVSAAYYLAPWPQPVIEVLYIVDSIYALLFLFDFFERLRQSTNKVRYMLPWGWLGLLGSLPGFPLLRIFRVAQILKISWHLGQVTPREVRLAARRRLAESTLLVTFAVGLLVVTVGSIAIILAESSSPEANIHTGSDAVWWTLVTIATVGYGDYYPVTSIGRVIGVVMIIVGVSIFSVLTSYISSVFLAGQRELPREVAALRTEIAALRQELQQNSGDKGR